jgi:hypothetical protein
MAQPGPWTVKRIGEMERAFGGALVRVRAELRVSAFGLQVAELPPDSGDLAPEHDHEHDGQEEVHVLDGTAVTLDRETFVRIGSGVRRRLRSGPQGARVLMIGAMPGRPYTPPPMTELGGPETLAPTADSSLIPENARTSEEARQI